MKSSLLSVYEKCSSFWPEKINLADCQQTVTGGVNCPELGTCYDRADDMASTNEIYSVMVWEMFKTFHNMGLKCSDESGGALIVVKDVPPISAISSFWKFYTSEDGEWLREWCEEYGIELINDYE